MLEVGKKIKQRREELNMTQDELARLTGYKSRSSINKIERGGNDLPPTKIAMFAQVLNTTPSDLMCWEDNNKRESAASDSDIKFALFDGDDGITDEMYEEVKNFAAFVKAREKAKK